MQVRPFSVDHLFDLPHGHGRFAHGRVRPLDHVGVPQVEQLVADRRRVGEAWEGFATRIDDIPDRKTPVLLRYYSPDRLFSDEARARFVDPDLAELPADSG